MRPAEWKSTEWSEGWFLVGCIKIALSLCLRRLNIQQSVAATLNRAECIFLLTLQPFPSPIPAFLIPHSLPPSPSTLSLHLPALSLQVDEVLDQVEAFMLASCCGADVKSGNSEKLNHYKQTECQRHPANTLWEVGHRGYIIQKCLLDTLHMWSVSAVVLVKPFGNAKGSGLCSIVW